jgi:hypothetical protein
MSFVSLLDKVSKRRGASREAPGMISRYCSDGYQERGRWDVPAAPPRLHCTLFYTEERDSGKEKKLSIGAVTKRCLIPPFPLRGRNTTHFLGIGVEKGRREEEEGKIGACSTGHFYGFVGIWPRGE